MSWTSDDQDVWLYIMTIIHAELKEVSIEIKQCDFSQKGNVNKIYKIYEGEY